MPCEILIAAEDKNHSLKGYPKNVKDTPAVWGTSEGPPGYVILRITNADKTQVEHFLAQWQKIFAYDIINENDQGYRIRVKVDPSVISFTGMNKNIRADMKTYIRDSYEANIVSYEDYEAVLEVPKPLTCRGQELTFAETKLDIHDKFAEIVDHRCYYFSSSDVDFMLTQPDGIWERTKAQALAMINNRLDE